MKTWPTKKLWDIIERQFSGVWGETPRATGNAHVIRVSDVEDAGIIDYENLPLRHVGETKIKKFQLLDGDLVVVKSSGSKKKIISGKTSIFKTQQDKIVIPSNFVFVLRPKTGIVLPIWLLLYLNGEEAKKFVASVVGVMTYPNLRPAQFLELRIPLPPIGEQKRIVAKIEKLFAKIDEAQRLRAESSTASAALLPSALHQAFTKQHPYKLENVRVLSEVAEINPAKSEIKNLSENTEVSFIPMAAVDERLQTIKESEVRKLASVRKGYTYFKEGDVLFAKITPCMENGKITIAQNLKNGIGFGSTEFHILRAKENVLSKWLFYFLWNPEFREKRKRI